MNISIKTKASINSHLEKIKNDTFQEVDVKLLLIDIRELIREETLLRELADFIAHPSRDKGIFNKKLNSIYLKFKFIDEQRKKLDFDKQNIKTERQYSDFILSAISIEKVDKKLFEVLFFDGLDDIDEKLFIKYYFMKKKQIKKLISDNYQLIDKKYYQLKSQNDFAKIEDILKFIRGTIQAKAVFNQQTFEKEIQKAIGRIINILNLDKSYLPAVKKNSKSILLCIMCLLHDSKFIFHDKHIGTCFLSLYPSNKKTIVEEVNKDSCIALISDNIGVHMPIFISNIKIGQYFLNETEIKNHHYMEKIPWINAIRDKQNQLMLTT